MRQGRRWRPTKNTAIWLLIVLLMAISITLIAKKAGWPG